MAGEKKRGKRLTVELTEEQIAALKPLMDQAGQVKIAGTLEEGRLEVSHLACNAPFQACNAPFQACNAPFQACNAPFQACNAPFEKGEGGERG